MGYEEIVEASHALENALDGLRQGGEITVAKIGCMLGVVDILKKLVRCAVEDGAATVPTPRTAEGAGDRAAAATGQDGAPDAKSSRSVRLLGEALVLLSNISDAPDQAGPVTRPVSPPETGSGSPESLSQRITSTKVELERLDRIMDLVGELTISRIRFSALASELGSKPLLDELALSWRLISQIQKEVMEARLIPVGPGLPALQPARARRLARNGKAREVRDRGRRDRPRPRRAREHGRSARSSHPERDRSRDRVPVRAPRRRKDRGGASRAERPPRAQQRRRSRSRTTAAASICDKVARAAAAAGIAKGRAADLTEDDVCRIITMPGIQHGRIGRQALGARHGHEHRQEDGRFARRLDTHPERRRGAGTTVTLLLPDQPFDHQGASLLGRTGRSRASDRVRQGDEPVRAGLAQDRPGGSRPSATATASFRFSCRTTSSGCRSNRRSERYAKVIVVDTGTRRFAVVVNSIIGQQDIVIKALPPLFRGLRGISGATVLGSGKVAFIWDPHILFEGRCTYESDQKAVVSEN